MPTRKSLILKKGKEADDLKAFAGDRKLTDRAAKVVTIMRYKIEFDVTETGGVFDLHEEGSYMEFDPDCCAKKVTVTSLLVFPTRMKSFCPPLNRYERLITNILHFNSNKGVFQKPVKVCMIPKGDVTNFVYLMHRLHPKANWSIIDVKVKRFNQLIFELDCPLGTVAVIRRFPSEEFDITQAGGLFYFANAKYGLLRVPKKSISTSITCVLRVIELNEDIGKVLRKDLDFVKDTLYVSEFYDFTFDATFDRDATLRLPLPTWLKDDGSLRERVKLFRKIKDEWNIVELNMQFTDTTVSFRVRTLGIFCFAVPKSSRYLRIELSINSFFASNVCDHIEILSFMSTKGKKWYLWVGCVPPAFADETIKRYIDNGYQRLRGVTAIGQAEYRKITDQRNQQRDLGFGFEDRPNKFTYGYEAMEFHVSVQGDVIMKQLVTQSSRLVKEKKDKELSNESRIMSNDICFQYFNALDDCSVAFEVEPAADTKTRAIENYIAFLCDISKTQEAAAISNTYNIDMGKYVMPRTPSPTKSSLLLPTKSPIKLCDTFDSEVASSVAPLSDEPLSISTDMSNDSSGITIRSARTSKRFNEYRLIEDFRFKLSDIQAAIIFSVTPPDSEQYIMKTFIISPTLENVLSYFGVDLVNLSTPESINQARRRSRSSRSSIRNTVANHLKHTLRPSPKQPECCVLTDRSFRVISDHLNNGMQLGLHLRLPEQVISNIGNRSIRRKLHPNEVTYEVLCAWKDTPDFVRKQNKDRVEQLSSCFTEMGRKDLQCILQLHYTMNTEMTEASFDRF